MLNNAANSEPGHALLARLLARHPEPIMRIDAGLRLRSANAAAQRRFGPLSLDSAGPLPLESWFVADDVEMIHGALAAEAESAQHLQVSGRGSWSGSWGVSVEPWDAIEPELGGQLLIFSESPSESSFNQRWQRLNSLWSMASGIAHLFNNRLTTALGNVFRLRARIGRDAEALPPLEQMESALLSMDRLTGELLRFTGTGDLSLLPLDLCNWLGDAGATLKRGLPKGVNLRVMLPKSAVNVFADVAALEQCLNAIVQNACDAIAEEGRVEIELERMPVAKVRQLEPWWMEPRAPAYAVLRVRDDGAGIDPELIDKAVEPFVTSRQPGRGLGLAVALGIAHGHHGGIHITRLPAGGTQVEVFLPVSADQASISGATGLSHGS